MKEFAELFTKLDQTNKTNEKVEVLKEYFKKVSNEDKINTLALFTGRRPKRQINSSYMTSWAIEVSGIPPWLFEESYNVVGDFAETVSMLVPTTTNASQKNLSEWMQEIRELKNKTEEEKKQWATNALLSLTQQEKFVFIKILSGAFRIGVSQSLIVKALADISGLDTSTLTHRIMGNWDPVTFSYEKLMQEQDTSDDVSRPYPFFLAYPLEFPDPENPESPAIGEPGEWQAEWKWDGIRAQIINRNSSIFIWSRGEDLATEKFPELHEFINALPDGTVLDGEIICLGPSQKSEELFRPLSFNVLQTRIGRKNLSKKILTESPVSLIVYDCLEFNGEDIRTKTQEERRKILNDLLNQYINPSIFISPIINFSSWKELADIRTGSREKGAEGIMLKRLNSTYQVGRKKGDWWKWKIDPLSVDAVMIYAMKGSGRRADLYTDYTFAVWDKDKLVSFAKAYSGLTDKEIREVDNFVKRNTLEKFGPVRTVKPELVFEIGFEGINKSSRHKSGIALRFPRILRWRKDKKKEDADTIETLRGILNQYNG